MKLRVSYRDPSAPEANLQITADATATAGDVAGALAAGPQGDRVAPEKITLAVTDQVGRRRVLQRAQQVITAGVISGAAVELAPEPDRSRREAVALARVVRGPDAGMEISLPLGPSMVGRDVDCDVRLTDARVSKHHARIEIADAIEVVDQNSSNGVRVGGVRVERVVLGAGDVVTIGDTDLVVYATRDLAGLAAGTEIDYLRSPRVLPRPVVETIAVPQPPQEEEPQPLPWIGMVVPLFMGLVMYLITQQLVTVVFMALMPLMLVGNWWDERRQQRNKRVRDERAFRVGLDRLDARVGELFTRQCAELLAAHPSAAECVRDIDTLGDLLWSRRPEHPEFLQIRLGLGDVAPYVAWEGDTAPGREELMAERDQHLARWAVLPDAPVVADLRSVGGVGIAGDAGLAEGVARAMVTAAVTLHAPSELVVACLTSKAGRERWAWLEWLPHAASAVSPFGSLQLASDAATGRLVLDRLEELIERRGGSVAPRGPLSDDKVSASPLPAVLVIVDEPLVDLGRLARLAEAGPDAGVHLLWVSQSRRLIPAACRTYVDLGQGAVVSVGMVRSGQLLSPVACESLDADTALRIARRMAPVSDVAMPVTDESDVPRLVTVMSLLGADSADVPDQVLARWKENGSYVDRAAPAVPREQAGDLRAVVGHTGIDPMTLDLRSQGPHALVGGTTGSGKSEFLQAWVLGLAHAYSPDRLTFLFVDYKGGAAFAKCTDLPHCVGIVTDLSPHLVRRALRSLRAEIHHRETLLQEKGVKDLIDFELTGDPACPPSLIIVVDEFAALKTEVPEFYDGIVDVAQRGRSLGLHLIMATQRPTGVITDSLRANTNLRVALRMNDDADSTDVLGSPMAARFDPGIPGRGAARTGPGRIAVFQAGFPGARTYAEPPAPPIEVQAMEFGIGRPWKVTKTEQTGPKPEKDITRIVEAVRQASALGGVPTPRRPWLDPLAPGYNLEALRQRTDAELVLGVMDDPDRQRQIVAYYRPDEVGNLMFVGTSGSGKTSALRMIAVAAGITPRGGPVQVYGIDFGGGGLSMLEALPYVGSIVPGDDEERLTRLLRFLGHLIDERAARYSAVRAATLDDYRRLAQAPDEPRVIVLLDNFGQFRHEYDTTIARTFYYDLFRRIAADGRAVGVHIVMSADRAMAVPVAVATTFQQRVVLRQTNEEAYIDLGVPRDVLTPASPPGRAMLADRPEELQLAILGDDASPLAQSRLIEQMAAEIAPFVRTRPQPILALPELVDPDAMPATLDGLPTLGVESVSLAPMAFDPRGTLLLTGPRQSGRTSALRWLAETLRRWSPGIELYHLSARRTPLSAWSGWTESVAGNDAVEALVTDKLSALVAAEADPDAPPAFAIVLEGMPDFADCMFEMQLAELFSLGRRNGHVVIAEGEVSEVTGFSTLVTETRNARRGFILAPETDDDSLFRTPLPRSKRTDFPPGRGVWVSAGKVWRVQLPLVEDA